ncbi:MAG: primosomal protein N' [Mollicutes bacterium]|nr:primosomal protein N' [Mollicutes bacterium]
MYAEVLVEYGAKSLDRTFTYIIPDHLKHLKVGMKVLVSFGKNTISGFVTKITDQTEVENLKEIIEIIDQDLVLNEELMSLGKCLNELTLCSLITAYQTMFPSSLKINTKDINYQLYDEYLEVVNINDANNFINNNPRKKRQIEILNYVLDNDNVLKQEFSGQPLNTLIKEGLIKIKKVKRVRIKPNKENYEKYKLTAEQNDVLEVIKSSLNKEKTFLIHGITGSGKTEVYLRAIKEVIKEGKTAIMLVPEISLTAQVVNQFYERFGDEVAVFHSALSPGEKYDEYLKIYNNQVKIVVGTRSAIFVPLENIGIIIIDEEHSDSYKQENNPRYHALDMAKFRSKYHNCPLVLGSATPTLESFARAKKDVYKLLKLQNRIGNSKLPNIEIVDMSLEMKKRNLIFSQILLDKIKSRLEKQEQVIILLNRRGFSTIVSCRNCGYKYECPHCAITLTYHKSSNMMRCHYCGYSKEKPLKCFQCQEEALKDAGLGTEKLEIELQKVFPSSKIIRMDKDTTTKKGSHEKIINEFKNNDYDILLGTQMIAKGLDFPRVSLVGVINADSSLNIPDFRSNERTFQLLSQVSGRAGRSKYPGEVVLQTFNPDNKTLNYIKNHDYEGFYNYEMNLRRLMSYPPYYYLITIKALSNSYEESSLEINKIKTHLLKNIDKQSIILGPTIANPFKVNNKYRFQLIIKYKIDKNIMNTLKEIDELYKTNTKVNIEIDTSPLSL